MTKRESELQNLVVDLSAVLAAFLTEVPMPLGISEQLERLLARSRTLIPEMKAAVTKRGKVREL